MSKKTKKPGELDIDFGIEGYAEIPAPPGALSKGSVYSWTTDAANRIIWSGAAPVDNEDFYFLSTLDAKGAWEPNPGFVEIEDPAIDPSLTFVEELSFLTSATPDQGSGFIAYSKCEKWTGEDYFFQAAVGHFQHNLAPIDGFGKKGFILLQPEGRDAKNASVITTLKVRHSKSVHNHLIDAGIPANLKNRYRQEVFAPAARSVLQGKTIKTLYASSFYGQPNSQTLWIALNDANTGEPVGGLGPDGSRTQWQIQNFLGNTFEPWGCHFFNDGGFALAGKEGAPGIVARYKSNGELDTEFNKSGFIELSNRNIQLGADENRIIIAQGTYRTSEPGTTINLTLRVYNKRTGAPDTTFNGNGVLSINIDPGTDTRALTTDAVIIDPNGMIYIAGNLMLDDGVSFYLQGIVHRITQDGKLDANFGTEGRFISPADKVNALRGAALKSDGLRFMSQLNEGGYCAMKLSI